MHMNGMSMPTFVIKTLFPVLSMLAILSGAAFAQDVEGAVKDRAQAIIPAAQEPYSQECIGLLKNGGDNLQASYTAARAFITWNSDPVYIAGLSGMVSVDGVRYHLDRIEMSDDIAYPVSAVYYPLSLRFVHKADNSSTLVLSVPVIEGAPNPAFEMMIVQPQSPHIDPNDLLPHDRSYGLLPTCSGNTGDRNFLLRAMEASPAQIEKLKQPA